MTRKAVVASAAILLAVAPARAQEAAQQLDGVLRCRAITDRDQRLACFDSGAASLDRARQSRSVLVLDRRAVVEQKQRRFGLGTPPGAAFGGGEADRETAVPRVDTVVRLAEPAPGAPGRWNLTLGNGMIWQTLEDVVQRPKTGSAITLERASLGGFRARLAAQKRAVPVKRLR